MTKTKRETKRGGFHALEKRIHELEEAERRTERTRESGRTTRPDERAAAPEILPPAAHDE